MKITKRSISAVIDVFFMRLITVVMYCMTVSISHTIHNRSICITRDRYIWKALHLVLLYIVVMLCVHFLYFFVSERMGSSIGKRLVRYDPAYGKADNRQAALVALCKTGACVLYVITLLYFLFTGNMPYDKIRAGRDVDAAPLFHSEE